LVREAISLGAVHYLRSDIKEFFTKVSKSSVADIVRSNTNDCKFSKLFEHVLASELSNPEEVKDWLHLFPLGDEGVPQGSSLSAFAANAILADFDQVMNQTGTTTIRYIDDFVVLGRDRSIVQSAFQRGQGILKQLGMDAYKPGDRSRKASEGKISSGFDFLGCRINSENVGPSRTAQKKCLEIVKSELREGRDRTSKYATENENRRAEETYIQTLMKADRKIRGWGDSFSFCDNRVPFSQLDKAIDDQLGQFRSWFGSQVTQADTRAFRRMYGVALLSDTPRSVESLSVRRR
jgi:hypothetical protein